MSFEDSPLTERSGLSSDLPRKLAALGEQLSDDAAFLASRYPPRLRGSQSGAPEAAIRRTTGTPIEQAIPVRNDVESPGRSLWRAIAVASAAAVVVGMAWWSGGWREESVGDRTNQRIYDSAEPSSRLVAQDGNSATEKSRDRATAHTTANVLEGLSGAEQEAVLDLLDSHLEREVLFSI